MALCSPGRRGSRSSSDPVRAMAGAGGRAAGSAGRRRAQRILVVSQLAASFMLLIGAGLLTRTLLRLYAIDPGFDLANVLSLQAPDFSVPNRDRRMQFSRDVLDRVRSEAGGAGRGHGVGRAARRVVPVPAGDPRRGRRRRRGRRARRSTVTRIVSSGYFETVGTRIKVGPRRSRPPTARRRRRS